MACHNQFKGESPQHTKQMTDTTIKALQQLAEALIANPADCKALQVYGEIPEHLADALHDFTDDHAGAE